MSKLLALHNLKGDALFKFLRENKEALITEKKSVLKRTDSFVFSPSVARFKKDGTIVKDAVGDDDEETMIPDSDKVHVTVVANAMNWCDSQMDVLINDSAKRSIKERKSMIPHLHDHIHEIAAKVGEVTNIYLQEMSLKDLGLNMTGSTQVIIFETDVMKSYNEKVYNQYKLGKINQHSIGLQYVKISLCINDEESEKEFDFWNKYYPLVINKDVVDERGYFWVVSEIKLIENSCVLFGSNELTPTLDVKADTGHQPPIGTGDHPLPFEAIKAIKSIVMCPSCITMFNTSDSGSSNCPGCGQYVSPVSTSGETPLFDTLGAIAETKFI
jgi:hypothetical protein